MIFLSRDFSKVVSTLSKSEGIEPIFISSNKRVAVLAVEEESVAFDFIVNADDEIFVGFEDETGGHKVLTVDVKTCQDLKFVKNGYVTIAITWAEEKTY